MDGFYQSRSKQGRSSSLRRVIILLIIGFLLFALSRNTNFTVERLRQLATDITLPATYIVTRPVVFIRGVASTAGAYLSLREDNLSLQKEVEQLRIIKRENRQLKQRLADYDELLGGQQQKGLASVMAHVLFDPGGPFVRTFVLDVGSQSGVQVGNTVIGKSGLVGRIVSVGLLSSRVLLLTDLNSRIPVRIGSSGVNAILSGTNTNNPQLIFISAAAGLSDGDNVVASGLGGQVERGIGIGEIRFDQNGNIGVNLYEKLASLNMVRILQKTYDGSSDIISDTPALLKPETNAQPNNTTIRE